VENLENNIKTDRNKCYAGVEWIQVVQDKVPKNFFSYTRQWNFGFHKRRGIFWPVEGLSGCQVGLCSMELISSTVPVCSNWNPWKVWNSRCTLLTQLGIRNELREHRQPTCHVMLCASLVTDFCWTGWRK